MSVEIFIARHGQNEDNANGILNGRRDLPLTKIGRQQASELGKGIVELGLMFDRVYCSPLSRAYETAKIVCETAGISVEPVKLDELIERDFGVMTGRHVSEIASLCSPDIIQTDTITYFLQPDGAETFPELLVRGQKVLDKVRARHATGNVLLVSHGDIGKMTYAAATGLNWEDVLRNFHFGNGELIEVSENNTVHVVKLPQFNH